MCHTNNLELLGLTAVATSPTIGIGSSGSRLALGGSDKEDLNSALCSVLPAQLGPKALALARLLTAPAFKNHELSQAQGLWPGPGLA